MDELEILPFWGNPDPEKLLCNRDLSKRIRFSDFKKKKKKKKKTILSKISGKKSEFRARKASFEYEK